MKYFAIIFAIILLSACGSGQKQSARPTAPVPTGPAQSQPVQALPTASLETLIFENIPTQSYTPRSRLFSIDFPDNWQTFEQADSVIFVDPKGQAGYSVLTSQVEVELSPQALDEFAIQFVRNNFGQEAGFEILAAETGNIRFKSVDANFGPSINEAAVTQQGQTVFITMLTAAEDKWETSAEALRQLTGSLQIHPLQSDASVATPTGPPMWELYTNPELSIAFLYPNNWIITQTEQSVQSVWPEYQMEFTVDAIPSPGAGEDLKMLENFIRTQSDALETQFDDVQMLPLSNFQAGDVSGYTFDYLYTNPSGKQIAGSIIALGVGDAIYRISISSPAPVYPTALEWFNPMLQSFQVLAE